MIGKGSVLQNSLLHEDTFSLVVSFAWRYFCMEGVSFALLTIFASVKKIPTKGKG